MFALITGQNFFPSTLGAMVTMRRARSNQLCHRDFVKKACSVNCTWNKDAFITAKRLEPLLLRMTDANPARRGSAEDALRAFCSIALDRLRELRAIAVAAIAAIAAIAADAANAQIAEIDALIVEIAGEQRRLEPGLLQSSS
jgi:hypothetical protein